MTFLPTDPKNFGAVGNRWKRAAMPEGDGRPRSRRALALCWRDGAAATFAVPALAWRPERTWER